LKDAKNIFQLGAFGSSSTSAVSLNETCRIQEKKFDRKVENEKLAKLLATRCDDKILQQS
jgi:hypothetical protein